MSFVWENLLKTVSSPSYKLWRKVWKSQVDWELAEKFELKLIEIRKDQVFVVGGGVRQENLIATLVFLPDQPSQGPGSATGSEGRLRWCLV